MRCGQIVCPLPFFGQAVFVGRSAFPRRSPKLLLDNINRECILKLYNLCFAGGGSKMFVVVDENDRRAIYQQVADGIRSLIASGELPEGTQLPPVRQLAADLGVNLNTIATAYRELQAEGLISVRHGSGAVVASRRALKRTDDELRRPLRTALTQLVLAGLPRAEIMSLVADELRGLLKSSKRG